MVEKEKEPKRKAVSWKNKYIALEDEYTKFKTGIENEEIDFEPEEPEEEPAQEEFFCPKCKNKINKYASVCGNCGENLIWEN